MSKTQDGAFDVSVIVPVHNAAPHLDALVRNVFALEQYGLRCQMICVDDASTDDSLVILGDLAGGYPGLLVVANDAGRGAGLARNVGWRHAQGRYSLFFDADDLLHGHVLAGAIRGMDQDPRTDLTFCAYRYERESSASFTEMGYEDRRIMDRLLAGRAFAAGGIVEMAPLLVFTNYPWNKVLRSARYRQVGMRFGRTMVNNDILGHWHSLLLARRIVLHDAVLCTHVVHPAGANLTNVFGPERLALFEALEETYDFLQARPALRRRFGHHFWALAQGLADWAKAHLERSFQGEFQARQAQLLARLDLGDLARMRAGLDPALATSLVHHLIR